MKKSSGDGSKNDLPIASQWIMDAAGEIGRSTIPNIFMIVCKDTGSKGTGFLLDNGYIVTNLHVTTGKLANIVAISSTGEEVKFTNWYYDNNKILDLILLKPAKTLVGGLSLAPESSTKIGESVHTWGYPLEYNGPAPLFSAGYLSGFNSITVQDRIIKRLVVNGAFNNGNSGGPLFKSGCNKIIGIVVAKHLPLSDFHRTAIQTMLANDSTGIVYTATDSTSGEVKKFLESQIVADILMHYQSLLQVMIGEAICASELDTLIRSVEATAPK